MTVLVAKHDRWVGFLTQSETSSGGMSVEVELACVVGSMWPRLLLVALLHGNAHPCSHGGGHDSESGRLLDLPDANSLLFGPSGYAYLHSEARQLVAPAQKRISRIMGRSGRAVPRSIYLGVNSDTSPFIACAAGDMLGHIVAASELLSELEFQRLLVRRSADWEAISRRTRERRQPTDHRGLDL